MLNNMQSGEVKTYIMRYRNSLRKVNCSNNIGVQFHDKDQCGVYVTTQFKT